MEAVYRKAEKIKSLILDVDGILTDGRVFFTPDGKEIKAFNTQDGIGIKLLQAIGVTVAVISGRYSTAVEKRMAELKVTHVYQGCEDKLSYYQQIKKELNLQDAQIAMMGDDLPDLTLMQYAGLSITVPNAVGTVKSYADWQTTYSGGEGAVREACELIIKAQGKFPMIYEKYQIKSL